MKLALILLLQLNVPFTISRGVHGAGVAFDLTTTVRLDGITPETNPVIGQRPVQQVAVVGGLAFTIDRLTVELHRNHPRIASVINYVAGGMHFGAGAWNLHVLHQH